MLLLPRALAVNKNTLSFDLRGFIMLKDCAAWVMNQDFLQSSVNTAIYVKFSKSPCLVRKTRCFNSSLVFILLLQFYIPVKGGLCYDILVPVRLYVCELSIFWAITSDSLKNF